MHTTTLFFDLDDTLYPASAGLWSVIRNRMSTYMVERLGLDPQEVERLRHEYLEKYGTTLRGLQEHIQVDTEDYLAFVHDLPLQKYLQPAPELRPILLSLPQKRWVFTNADLAHARRVLDILGLQDCFQGIIDIRAIDFQPKPDLAAYQRAMQLAGAAQPQDCLLIDDAPRNLAPAKILGFRTALVKSRHSEAHADYFLDRIQDLPSVIPDLWNGFKS